MTFKTKTHCAEIDSDINSRFIAITKEYFAPNDLSAIKIVVTADEMLHAYVSNYDLYNFDLFWNEKIKDHYSREEQCVMLHYILIHATQNIEMRVLMGCYNHIKNYLKNKEMHPAFIQMITNHIVRIPSHIGYAEFKAWIQSRSAIFKKSNLLKACVYHKKFLRFLRSRLVRKDIKASVERVSTPNETMDVVDREKPLQIDLKRRADGRVINGAFSVLFTMVRLYYKYFIRKNDDKGNVILTEKSFFSQIGIAFSIDMTNFYNSSSRELKKKKWKELAEQLDYCVT